MTEVIVDFAAAGRVAARVELAGIRVAEVSATCNPKIIGTLEPTVAHDCQMAGRDGNALEISCSYRFTARVGQTQVAEAAIKYLLQYQIMGNEPLADGDLAQFASSNGTLHSWPFLREFLYDLTSRMGYPPYTLGVVHFKPNPVAPAPAAPPLATPAATERVAGKPKTP